jgi:hypothetical protein
MYESLRLLLWCLLKDEVLVVVTALHAIWKKALRVYRLQFRGQKAEVKQNACLLGMVCACKPKENASPTTLN